MRILLGSDHAGFKTKEKIKRFLSTKKTGKTDKHHSAKNSIKNSFEITDITPVYKKNDDYPDYAKKIAKLVAKDRKALTKAILVCGTGTGMVIAANRIKGVRAVAAYDAYSAKMSRADNNSNILALRGRNFSFEKIKKIISIWLKTPFSNLKKHKKRIKKIDSIK